VYVFAPTAVGLLAALAVTPFLVRRFRERIVALAGFVVVATTLCLLGFLPDIAGAVDAVNPMRLAGLLGIDLSERLRTAGLLAAFIGFGLSMTTTSVQTYINRRVPLHLQGRAFALQSTLKNGGAIIPLLTLGAAASYFGVENVLIFSPFVLLILAASLVRLSYALGGRAPASRLDVLASFWQESSHDDISAAPPLRSSERGLGGEAPGGEAPKPDDEDQHHGA
jgi:MFS family permease